MAAVQAGDNMAETISAEVPQWVTQRARWFDQNQSSTSQDIQLGAQIAQQWQQNQRLQRAQALQEEVKRLAIEEKERIAEGTVAIARILSKMGQTPGGYTDSALQGEFWGAIRDNPKFASSQAFKDIMDTFQASEQAKARSELETLRQQSITDRSEAAIQSRFDLLNQRLEGMTALEGVKAEHRTQLEELKGEINMLRDSLKPTRVGQLVHDLPEADLVAMRSELTALDKKYEKGRIKGKGGGIFSNVPKTTAEQEYDAERQAILKKYDAKRIGTPRPAETAPAAEKRVRVKSPDGKIGNIPESQLEDALKQGYTPAP